MTTSMHRLTRDEPATDDELRHIAEMYETLLSSGTGRSVHIPRDGAPVCGTTPQRHDMMEKDTSILRTQPLCRKCLTAWRTRNPVGK